MWLRRGLNGLSGNMWLFGSKLIFVPAFRHVSVNWGPGPGGTTGLSEWLQLGMGLYRVNTAAAVHVFLRNMLFRLCSLTITISILFWSRKDYIGLWGFDVRARNRMLRGKRHGVRLPWSCVQRRRYWVPIAGCYFGSLEWFLRMEVVVPPQVLAEPYYTATVEDGAPGGKPIGQCHRLRIVQTGTYWEPNGSNTNGSYGIGCLANVYKTTLFPLAFP